MEGTDKVFMNPYEAVNKAAELLKRNPQDRALRIERDVLESVLLGFLDFMNQLRAIKEKDAGVSDDKAAETADAKP